MQNQIFFSTSLRCRHKNCCDAKSRKHSYVIIATEFADVKQGCQFGFVETKHLKSGSFLKRLVSNIWFGSFGSFLVLFHTVWFQIFCLVLFQISGVFCMRCLKISLTEKKITKFFAPSARSISYILKFRFQSQKIAQMFCNIC